MNDRPAQPPTGVGLDGLRRRPPAAGPASCGSRPPRRCSARGRRPRGSCSSASSPATRRTARASRSSARPGKLLDRALADAGIDRRDAYVTNAVKHFRFTPKGKRRIHQTPGPEHLRACRPWLEAEFAVLSRRSSSASGATAAKALISPSFRITKDRGQLLPWTPPGRRRPLTRAGGRRRRATRAPAQTWMLATTHPSAILRTPDERRAAAYDALVADLTWSPAPSPDEVRTGRPACRSARRSWPSGRRAIPAGAPTGDARRGTARTRARRGRRRPSPRRSPRPRRPSRR